MIEFCTKRRMIISIVILGVLTVGILILEEALTSDINLGHLQNTTVHQVLYSSSPIPSDSISHTKILNLSSEDKKKSCWLFESYKIIKGCTFCSDFELSSKTPAACTETGLKEVIQCVSSGLTYRSCSKNPSLEQRRFWIFESLMLLTAIVSYGLVKIRRTQLELRTVKNIETRLAAGN